MAINSTIEWCDHTYNPWWGCTRVSDGCRHCYAERLAHRFESGLWGVGAARKRASAATRNDVLRIARRAERLVRRYRVFCASMADVFDDHESIQDEWVIDLGKLICDTPSLDWLLLTKRPHLIGERLPVMFLPHSGHLPAPPTVRIGVSVEDQATADERIPELLRQWQGPNFISYEPALGAVNFMPWLQIGRLHWVIAGGESGPGARDADPEWFRSVRDQCRGAGVPFFAKQMAKKAPIPADLMVREFPRYE